MNIPQELKIPVVCLFCGAPLEGPIGTSYSSGDLIKCLQCGEGNDFDSVVKVAQEKGVKQVASAVRDDIKKTFKDLFKK
jgi:hypothetical protein